MHWLTKQRRIRSWKSRIQLIFKRSRCNLPTKVSNSIKSNCQSINLITCAYPSLFFLRQINLIKLLERGICLSNRIIWPLNYQVSYKILWLVIHLLQVQLEALRQVLPCKEDAHQISVMQSIIKITCSLGIQIASQTWSKLITINPSIQIIAFRKLKIEIGIIWKKLTFTENHWPLLSILRTKVWTILRRSGKRVKNKLLQVAVSLLPLQLWMVQELKVQNDLFQKRVSMLP